MPQKIIKRPWHLIMAGLGISLASLILLGQSPASSGDQENSVTHGLIVGILDGDTISVFNGAEEVRVRLADIDAPEKDQPHGKAAKLKLSKLAYRCTATLYDEKKDRYGRIVARVRACGHDLSESLLDEGYAWVYDDYVSFANKERLNMIEDRAKKARRGLWADSNPIPPWEWRKNH
jgi:endonuclease YncB( thermonuclease family)